MDFLLKVVFTWWPPLDDDNAFPRGEQVIVLARHPKKHINRSNDDIVFHELTHSISAKQSRQQKGQVSELFLRRCPSAAALQARRIWRQCMAVIVGQMIYLKNIWSNRYDEHISRDNWYNDPWVNAFAKQSFEKTYDHFHNSKLESELVDALGTICSQLDPENF